MRINNITSPSYKSVISFKKPHLNKTGIGFALKTVKESLQNIFL